MSALRRHVLANFFKTSNAVVVAWPHLLVALTSRNHPIALLMPQRGRRPQHQKQTFCDARAMSALPPKAHICSAPADVCFVPIADVAMMITDLGLQEALGYLLQASVRDLWAPARWTYFGLCVSRHHRAVSPILSDRRR